MKALQQGRPDVITITRADPVPPPQGSQEVRAKSSKKKLPSPSLPKKKKAVARDSSPSRSSSEEDEQSVEELPQEQEEAKQADQTELSPEGERLLQALISKMWDARLCAGCPSCHQKIKACKCWTEMQDNAGSAAQNVDMHIPSSE